MKVSDFLKVISVFFVVTGVVPSVAADSEDKSPQQRLCDVYKHHYDGANKNMVSISAAGVYDDNHMTSDGGVHRQTMRELQILNERVLQLIVIFQMQAHECPIPKIPSYSTTQGYDCQFERMKGNFDMCDHLQHLTHSDRRDRHIRQFVEEFVKKYNHNYHKNLEHFFQ